MKWNLRKTFGMTLIFYITMHKLGIHFTTIEAIIVGFAFGLLTWEVVAND